MKNIEKLVSDYIPLANKIARKYSEIFPKCVSLDELRSAAYVGLFDAARRFDDSKKASFGSYAAIRMSGEIKDHLRFVLRKHRIEAHTEHASQEISSLITDDFFDFVTEVLGISDGKMMRMYYIENKTLKEIGLSKGVSESRASQMMKACHARLKCALA